MSTVTNTVRRLRCLLSNAGGRVIVKNIGWLFFDKAIRMFGGLFVGVWVARYLGPFRFGTLNFAVALASLLTALSTLGLDGLIVRDVIREPSARKEILGTALALRCGAGLVTISLIQFIAWIARPEEGVTRAVVAVVSLATVGAAVDVVKPWYESQIRSRYTVIAENAAFAFAAIIRVALVLSKGPLVLFAISMTVEVVIAKVVLWLFYASSGERISDFAIRMERAIALLTEGWPLILSGLAVMLYMRIDQIMLASMVGYEEVGIYSAAVRISEIWYFMPVTIVASVAPHLTATQYTDPAKYRRRFQQLLSLLALISYAAIIPVTFCGPWFIRWLYGDKYLDAGIVLSLHIWAGFFVSLGVASSRWLLNGGLTKILLIRTIAGAIVNVILNSVFIPRFGAKGAAFATVVSHAVSDVLIHVLRKESRPLFLAQLKAFILAGIAR